MLKKTIRAISIIFIFGVSLWLTRPFWLDNVGAFLIVQDKLQPADVIVVLSGDGNGERMMEGIKLYRKKYAKKILVSGGLFAWRLTEADWMKHQAVVLGIPAAAILLEDKSFSTLDNARFSLPILIKRKARRIILVTSPYHTRRAKRVFQKVFSGAEIEVIVVPARESKFKVKGWWRRHEDTQLVVNEYLSSVFYYLKGY
ncbi:YdcF family protein [Candidatus Saganbacteria bacterium]|nr:YdcF family protein [Candidatus Saganbacteria bacterium]